MFHTLKTFAARGSFSKSISNGSMSTSIKSCNNSRSMSLSFSKDDKGGVPLGDSNSLFIYWIYRPSHCHDWAAYNNKYNNKSRSLETKYSSPSLMPLIEPGMMPVVPVIKRAIMCDFIFFFQKPLSESPWLLNESSR